MRACTGRRKGDRARGKHAHMHVPLETCRRRPSWLRGRAQGAVCPSLRGPGGCHLWGTGWMCLCVSLAQSEGLALPRPPLQSQEERVSPGRPGSWQPTAGPASAVSSSCVLASSHGLHLGSGTGRRLPRRCCVPHLLTVRQPPGLPRERTPPCQSSEDPSPPAGLTERGLE